MTGVNRPPTTYGPLGNVQPILGRGDLTLDAWGRQKVVNDESLFHGMFTYSIPPTRWFESVNGVEQTSFSAATSVNSKLNLTSSSNTVNLQSFRYPRYQPNRGILYSNSVFLPNPMADGVRDFGIFTAENGVFFRLKSDGLYACRRFTVDSLTTTLEFKIEDTFGLDFSKGNIFDIQMQWRGVGNVYFFGGDADEQVSKMLYCMKLLNTNDELSIQNPALPIAFECISGADDVTIQCGCVDLSTEGGSRTNRTYGSLTTSTESGQVQVNDFNQPVLAVRSNKVLGGKINTRDIQNLSVAGYADQRCVLRVWVTRDFTAITPGTEVWTPFRDGALEYIERTNLGTDPTFDTAKATIQFGGRINLDETFVSSAVFDDNTELFLTPGDMLIFTIHRENGNNANVGVTYEFAEEI